MGKRESIGELKKNDHRQPNKGTHITDLTLDSVIQFDCEVIQFDCEVIQFDCAVNADVFAIYHLFT